MPRPAAQPTSVLHLRRKQEPLNPDPLRIVLVDDEEFFVLILAQMLRSRYDATIQPFTSSQAAWEELDRASPDMLIVGGVMPPPCGEEIVRRLMARNVSYPILVVSGYLSTGDVLSWFPAAPNISFLRKPFGSQQRYAAVENQFEIVSTDAG